MKTNLEYNMEEILNLIIVSLFVSFTVVYDVYKSFILFNSIIIDKN